MDVKVVSSLYGETPDASKVERFAECLEFRTANAAALKKAGVDLAQPDSLGQLAVAFSDGVIEGEAGKVDALLKLAADRKIPVLNTPAEEEKGAAYNEFFNLVVDSKSKPPRRGSTREGNIPKRIALRDSNKSVF